MGGFELLKAISEFNKSQPSFEEEELSKNLCPYCDWPLKVKDDVKLCPMCGRKYD
jgi:rubrerythrin